MYKYATDVFWWQAEKRRDYTTLTMLTVSLYLVFHLQLQHDSRSRVKLHKSYFEFLYFDDIWIETELVIQCQRSSYLKGSVVNWLWPNSTMKLTRCRSRNFPKWQNIINIVIVISIIKNQIWQSEIQIYNTGRFYCVMFLEMTYIMN